MAGVIQESNKVVMEGNKIIKSNFVQVELKDGDKTSVWHYFLRSDNKTLGRCKLCEKIIKSTGGSTSGLMTHLRTMHQIDLRKKKATTENEGIILAIVLYDLLRT